MSKNYNDLGCDLNIGEGIKVKLECSNSNKPEKILIDQKKIFNLRLKYIKKGYIKDCCKISRNINTYYFVKCLNKVQIRNELKRLNDLRLEIEKLETSIIKKIT